MPKFGFSDADWDGLITEAASLIAVRASAGKTITYGELAQSLKGATFEAYDPRLFELLGDVSIREDEAGRGMLSVLVVSKETFAPGPGFFTLAKARGSDISDRTTLQIEESRRVWAAWAAPQ